MIKTVIHNPRLDWRKPKLVIQEFWLLNVTIGIRNPKLGGFNQGMPTLKFFHASVKQCRNPNFISQIFDDSSGWIEEESLIL